MSTAPALVVATDSVTLHDYQPEAGSFREDVLAGLSATPKATPPKYFYDERGSQLFDRITELEEYYPTRTEVGIMRAHIDAMTRRIGPRALLIEYGSGSSLKTRILLDHLRSPAGYVPIEISRAHLLEATERLAEAYPSLPILPVRADYTARFDVPEPAGRVLHRVIYFPGSTIGNVEPEDAVGFMENMAAVAGAGGGLLIGVDLKKDVDVLEAAYDDAEGVTAAFNKNLLVRMNRELGADFDLDRFAHRALYNEERGCIEMHLVSLDDQEVTVGDAVFAFDEGETIRTERSYKYAPEEFADLASRAGWQTRAVWRDKRRYFSVQYLAV